jgi:hypothetical protein
VLGNNILDTTVQFEHVTTGVCHIILMYRHLTSGIGSRTTGHMMSRKTTEAMIDFFTEAHLQRPNHTKNESAARILLTGVEGNYVTPVPHARHNDADGVGQHERWHRQKVSTSAPASGAPFTYLGTCYNWHDSCPS